MTIREFEGHKPQLGTEVYIDESAVVIGKVNMGDNSSVFPGAVLRGDVHTITVGERSNIQDNCVLHVTHESDYDPGGYPLKVGNNVIVGHSVVLHGCTIDDFVLLGMGAVVMDGAHIMDNVLIAAGSLVSPRAQLESGYVYRGRPARKIRPLSDREKSYISYGVDHYVKLKNRYLNHLK